MEIAFKTMLQFSRGRGRGISSNRGIGDIVVDQRCSRDNYDHEEKYQQRLSNLRGSNNITSHQGNQRYDMLKV